MGAATRCPVQAPQLAVFPETRKARFQGFDFSEDHFEGWAIPLFEGDLEKSPHRVTPFDEALRRCGAAAREGEREEKRGRPQGAQLPPFEV